MPELRCPRLDQRQRRLRALLHHLAELARENQLAGPRHARRLDEQDVAADRRPRKPGRNAGHARAHRDFGLELARPEYRGQIVRVDLHAASLRLRRCAPRRCRNTEPISRSRLRTPASRV